MALLFMTRQDVLNGLRAAKEINVVDDTDLWRKAFDLYREATGVKMNARDRCSKCFKMVREWLEKE
jgi:hypothetical protein